MTMPRRMFLGLGALAALSAASPALADRRRILTSPEQPEPVASGRLPELGRALGRLHVGSASQHGGLLVFWLVGGPPASTVTVETLDEARASGALAITERDRADRARGHGGKSGQGARPAAGRRDPGRRQAEPRAAGRHPAAAAQRPPGARRLLRRAGALERGSAGLREQVELCRARASAQGVRQGRPESVWSEVPGLDRGGRGAGPRELPGGVREAGSPRAPGRGGAAARGAGRRGRARRRGVRGLGAEGHRRVRTSDLFAREWRKLLRAHAVDVYRRPAILPMPEDKLRGEVARCSAPRFGRRRVRGNPGVGRLFEFKLGQYRGAALAYEGGIVHAAIL